MSLFGSMAAILGQLRRRRAYAPTSNTASQDNHEKINSWVSFIFPQHDEYGAPLGGPSGRRSSAIKEFYPEYKRISKVIIFQSFFNERPFKSVKSFFKIDEKEKSWNFFDICIS